MNALILSHNNYGELCILINGKEYTYFHVGQFHLAKIRQFIAQDNTKLFAYLKNFSDKSCLDNLQSAN